MVFGLIAKMYVGSQQYQQAQNFFERVVASHRAAGTPVPHEVQTNLQLYRMNTRHLASQLGAGLGGGSGPGLDLPKRLSFFKRL